MKLRSLAVALAAAVLAALPAVGRGSPVRAPVSAPPAAPSAAGAAPSAGVSPVAAAAAGGSVAEDPLLDGLVREALERRPEWAQARALLVAQRERVPQAGALPDPTLTLGIQNDGFREIQIGKMGTSYWQVMLTQPLPWPGKRGLRTEVASGEAAVAEASLERVRLGVEADVRRAYLELLLTRDQLVLLARLEELWAESEGIAKIRYGVGGAPQSDLLRAQLERTRLQGQRWSLELAEQMRLQELNRLRGRPVDEPLATSRHLAGAALPALPTVSEAEADAEARSPELRAAALSTKAAASRAALSRRDRYPDLSVTAAVMPRGGLEPMWQLAVGIGLPVWSGRKQARAVAESEARQGAEERGEEGVRQVLRMRTHQRLTQLETALRVVELYRGGLLVQSSAAVESTFASYRVGRVTFGAVLEALGGYVADEGGSLEALAQAQRVAIAQRELSLEAAPGGGGGLVAARPGAGSSAGSGAAGMGSGLGKAQAASSPASGSASGGAGGSSGM